MAVVFCGIDPGKQGAFFLLERGGSVLGSWKMPLAGSGAGSICPYGIWEVLKAIRLEALKLDAQCVFGVEKVFTMPSDVESILGAVKAAREATDLVHINGHLDTIENLSRKKDGRVGILNYGIGYGYLLGQIAVLGYPLLVYSPRTWQKLMWEGTDHKLKSKDRSFQAASRLFPVEHLRAAGQRKQFHDGIVDAALIAEYCRRSYKPPG